MKAAVIGSRGLYADMDRYLPEVEKQLSDNITMIISGGARGIDALAAEYADKRGIPKMILLPDYKKHGRSAPIMRNAAIVRNADIIIAFWDGSSRGTKFVIEYAGIQGKRLIVYTLKANDLKSV